MGDKKPSEFYRHMQQLVGESNEIGRNTMRKLFISRLPKSMTHSLILLENQPINEQLEIADKLWEVETSRSLCINSATKHNNENTMEDNSSEISRLGKEISELKLAIEVLGREVTDNKRPSRDSSRGRRSQYRNRSKSREWNRSPSISKTNLCWYHDKFGEKATKCCKPCKFFSNSNNNDDQKNSSILKPQRQVEGITLNQAAYS